MNDTPKLIGKIADVANGDISESYAFIQALISATSIYGEAELYDRPYGEIQVAVKQADDGGVSIRTLDYRAAEQHGREDALGHVVDSRAGIERRNETVLRYAAQLDDWQTAAVV